MTTQTSIGLRTVSAIVAVLGAAMAVAGLFWTPPGALPDNPDLYGHGLYRRDTPFNAGVGQGSDVLTLILVLPAMLWAMVGRLSPLRRIVLAGAHAWFLYLGTSLSFGAIAFNEAFPLYVLVMPLAALGVTLSLGTLELSDPPPYLPAFLMACGVVTGAVWALLLWLEMSSGAYPPATYYTARTTYALDIGVIAPGCMAAAVGLWRGRAWGTWLGVPLLAIAALLLPMMAAQTIMQLRAGVSFGPEAAAPFLGFGLISAGSAYFLREIARAAQVRAAVADRALRDASPS